MSLEAALQENTSVMRELIARLSSASSTAVTMPASEYVAKLDAAEKVTAPADTKVEAAKPEAAVIDYEKEVRPVLVKVSTTKGRDPLIALLAQFNVTKGDQLKPVQFGDVIAAANELLAA
jgi:hypothetical protein